MTNNSLFFKHILAMEEEIVRETDKIGFHAAIRRTLSTFNLQSFEGMATLRECLPLTRQVNQYYAPTGFGKFNLTLVNNGAFFIMAMFMDDLSTEIHDHPFEGAFIPLAGRPTQLTFTFNSEKSLTTFIDQGSLNVTGCKSIAPGELIEIHKESIHMLSRAHKGQFSLLICRLLPPESRQNHFYLHPTLKIKNRPNLGYLARVTSSLHDGEDPQTLLQTLETDELIQLYLRTHIQLTQMPLTSELTLGIRKCTGELLKQANLWGAIHGHLEFMSNTQKKLGLL